MSKRNSNMELLRILAMLMIVAYHMLVNCINVQLNYGSDLSFCTPQFYNRLILLYFITPFGKVGNVIFITISGYFMASRGKNIDLTKIAKKLLTQQAFACVALMILSTILYNHLCSYCHFSPYDINLFNDFNWFVGYYFAIIVIAKLFLNNFLEKLDKKQYLMFVVTVFALTQLGWSREILDGLSGHLGYLVSGLSVYSFGGYIRKYNPFEKIRLPILFLIIVVCYLFIIQSNYNTVIGDIASYSGDGTFIQNIVLYNEINTVVIVLGVTIFEIFRRINIPNSKIINFLGASTFMVYLIHSNELFSSYYRFTEWITLLYNKPINYVAKFILCALTTFAIGVLAYAIYLLIGKLCSKLKFLVFKN